jgi:hypothetical protein
MYLEHHYLFKGDLYLSDKHYDHFSRGCEHKVFNHLCLEFSIKQADKKISLIFFILLSIWHANVGDVNGRYSVVINNQNLIFAFLNNFITILLPLTLNVKIQRLSESTTSFSYEFDYTSMTTLLEPLCELNSHHTRTLTNGRIKFNLSSILKDLFIKESLSRFFKFPLNLDC